MENNIIVTKSKAFAIRIINLYKFLCENNEYILSKQLLRSGTSIGANIREAVSGYSKKEFAAKMSISLKEAEETAYWLELLVETNYITQVQFESIYGENKELIKILVSIIKASKGQ